MKEGVKLYLEAGADAARDALAGRRVPAHLWRGPC